MRGGSQIASMLSCLIPSICVLSPLLSMFCIVNFFSISTFRIICVGGSNPALPLSIFLLFLQSMVLVSIGD